ncbi:uncharacterized protein LOC110735842, partial [Chenopodium quinoa]|uniref:uncharacterized protein LOC110735842 n=1 Tax=Chenopodium quinoa TaxID=63459 RepID=UPI000B77F216
GEEEVEDDCDDCIAEPEEKTSLVIRRALQARVEEDAAPNDNTFSSPVVKLVTRPWQTDKRSIHDGYHNTYTIVHEGRKKKLHPLPPPRFSPSQTPQKEVSLLSLKEFERELDGEGELFILYSKETHENFVAQNPKLAQLIKDFEDVFPNELPKELPPIRGIEHQIDLIPGAPLPNKPAYRCNPLETKELQRQIEELMGMGYVRES